VLIDGHDIYIDHDGQKALPKTYGFAMPFAGGIAPVVNRAPNEFRSDGEVFTAVERQWVYIDKKGKEVLTPGFCEQGVFSEGLVAVALGKWQGYTRPDNWTFMNSQGKLAFPPQFSRAHHFSEGVAPVETGRWQDIGNGMRSWIPRGWNYIDKTGKIAIKGDFEAADPFSGSLASVKVKGKWGYIDHSGKMVIPPIYDASLLFVDGLSPVIPAALPQAAAQ
jgi:hypothetical protein